MSGAMPSSKVLNVHNVLNVLKHCPKLAKIPGSLRGGCADRGQTVRSIPFAIKIGDGLLQGELPKRGELGEAKSQKRGEATR